MNLNLSNVGLPTKEQMLESVINDLIPEMDANDQARLVKAFFTELMEEHTCCDTQTFNFRKPYYQKILRTKDAS